MRPEEGQKVKYSILIGYNRHNEPDGRGKERIFIQKYPLRF